jgi:hypothetical protein
MSVAAKREKRFTAKEESDAMLIRNRISSKITIVSFDPSGGIS